MAPQLLTRVLSDNIAAYGPYPLLYDGPRTFTNVDTLNHADRISRLLASLGVGPGDRVVVSMPNAAEVIFAYYGVLGAGGVIVPVMFLLQPPEFTYILRDSGAKVVLTDATVLPKITAAAAGLEHPPAVVVMGPQAMPERVDAGGLTLLRYDPQAAGPPYDGPSPRPALTEEDVAVILYTSGTTGRPKGVMLMHRNLYGNAANLVQLSADRARETTLGVLPLAHVYGFTAATVTLMVGGALVIMARFDPKAVFEAIERFRIRSFAAVPAMIHAMVHSPDADRYDLSSLESVSSGSAPLPVTLLEAFRARFHAEVYEGYGLSEAAPVVTGHRRGMPVKPGTVGVPIPGVAIRIVDEHGRDVPPGEVGELWVRGVGVMKGYYRNPEATRAVLTPDGWLATGDMARVDADGYVSIVDRKKDLIIRGGFNIYPRDVEEVLLGHPGVLEAAVVGIPSERLGEEAVAWVVRRDPALTEEELVAYCRDRMAHYKAPTRIFFAEQLPKNGVGKVLKTELRARARELAGR
ncbi:MAG: AMP-binding protein [Actinomycetia bacterium]|nr:AMP-binding protein [Actinomycetes bacterium]